MRTVDARDIRCGILYGRKWAESALTAGRNPMLRALLMNEIITWSRRNSRPAKAAATRIIRRARQHYLVSHH